MIRLRASRFGETGSRRPLVRGLVALAMLVLAAGAVAVGMWEPTPDREIRLVARGMAFYAGTDPTPNPTITVRSGERVRIVLENRDRGMTHDFAVPTLHAATSGIDWNESASVVIEVPATPGTYEYVCRPHAALNMRGTIIVE